MLIEKMFGNTFGMIWLIMFLVAIIASIVWLLIKKEQSVKEEDSIDEMIENSKSEVVKDEIIKEEIIEEKVVNKEYEIIESEDGFFRVRKTGNERTLRKFATSKEAEDFVKEKESK